MPLEYPQVTSSTCLSSNGQITLPDQILDGLGLKTGDHITFTLLPDGNVLMRAKKKAVTEQTGVLIEEGCAPLPLNQLPV